MNAQSTAVESDNPAGAVRSPARILVLHANKRARWWLVAELELAGHEVLPAATPRDALAAWVESREPVDLLVMNPLTARGEGLFLWSRLSSLQPNIPVVLPIACPDVSRGPAARAELRSKVRDALATAAWFSRRVT